MPTIITRRQAIGGALLTSLAAALPSEMRAQQSPFGTPETTPRLTNIHRVILDVDPGNDDALAMLLALTTPALQVEAVTVCPGNMGPNYDQQVRNALFMVDLAGQSGKVPVHRGMSHPLLNLPYPVATFIHGKYGLGTVEVTAVKQQPSPEHAVDAMLRIVNSAPGRITIAALGGLTNVAMAILRDPAFARNVQGIQFVGGRYASPGFAPSYNVLVDPEAAHIVLTSGIPITMVGADVVARDSVLTDEDFATAATFHTRFSDFFLQSNELRRTYEKAHRGTTGSTNPDPLAVAIAIQPTLATRYISVHMSVELEGTLTRGLLVYAEDIYREHPIPTPNVDICTNVDAPAFRQLIFNTLKKS